LARLLIVAVRTFGPTDATTVEPMRTLKPVRGLPPFAGATQVTPIEELVAEVWRGAFGREGPPNGINVKIAVEAEVPAGPSAVTLKLYTAPPSRPVTVAGEVSDKPGVHSVQVVAAASLNQTVCEIA
jgi:hypothetical protein